MSTEQQGHLLKHLRIRDLRKAFESPFDKQVDLLCGVYGTLPPDSPLRKRITDALEHAEQALKGELESADEELQTVEWLELVIECQRIRPVQ